MIILLFEDNSAIYAIIPREAYFIDMSNRSLIDHTIGVFLHYKDNKGHPGGVYIYVSIFFVKV